jgi:putative transposase
VQKRQGQRLDRRSPRLKGFNYRETGEYFVTVCTAGKKHLFGEVVDGELAISEVGRIVESCWQEIPNHFPHVRTPAFQIMPNHIHGIIEIRHVGAQHAAPLHISKSLPLPGSLGAIVRSFKSAVARATHETMQDSSCLIWQRSYYDRIIRDDREQFFIEQYITLNPLLWHFDRNNQQGSGASPEVLRARLREDFHLDEYSVEYLLTQLDLDLHA